MQQLCHAVLMVRPACFAANLQTAASNTFQATEAVENSDALALHEFDHCVALLRGQRIDVLVMEEPAGQASPDAIFPNNWFSTHAGGRVIMYPLMAPNRRHERRAGLLEKTFTAHGYFVRKVIDLGPCENRGLFLEGTGSLVFDHASRTAYAALSARTTESLVHRVCEALDYEPFVFDSILDGHPVYHTNVLLSISERFAVLADDCLPDSDRRRELRRRLEDSGMEVIGISTSQVRRFAGNILSVKNTLDETVVIMSETARGAFVPSQLKAISQYGKIIAVPVPVIERTGGGSVRCMLAEIYLEKGVRPVGR